MKVTALAHVLASAVLAPGLAGMEIRRNENPEAAVAELGRLQASDWGRWGWRRSLDIACPDACRGQRDAELPAYLAKRAALSSEFSGACLLP